MITKEKLQEIMQQTNAVDEVFKLLSEQSERILSLETELRQLTENITNELSRL